MDDAIVVLITAGSADEAARLARSLVDGHLAACVNIVPSVRSIYFWEGATQDAQEALMICKTVRRRLPDVMKRVTELHSYTVPEVIALPVVEGLPAYLSWIEGSTGQGA